ncbi:MAG: DUF4393 domain-containing protein [Acidobacteriia bacterium]|nr:DUF4393 domain-containing protein [Terriglobia bacterium]
MDAHAGQTTELAKSALKEVLAPVMDLFQRLLGPAADEVGQSFADSARVWRLKRAIRLVEHVKVLVESAGIDVRPVAPRLLFPILDGASLEDDDELQHRWAALLTNAATPDFESEVFPSFPGILKEITSAEAQFLDRSFEEVIVAERGRGQDWAEYRLQPETVALASAVMLGNLQRLGLLTIHQPLPIQVNGQDVFDQRVRFSLSPFGKAFVRACRPPDSDSRDHQRSG